MEKEGSRNILENPSQSPWDTLNPAENVAPPAGRPTCVTVLAARPMVSPQRDAIPFNMSTSFFLETINLHCDEHNLIASLVGTISLFWSYELLFHFELSISFCFPIFLSFTSANLQNFNKALCISFSAQNCMYPTRNAYRLSKSWFVHKIIPT